MIPNLSRNEVPRWPIGSFSMSDFRFLNAVSYEVDFFPTENDLFPIQHDAAEGFRPTVLMLRFLI